MEQTGQSSQQQKRPFFVYGTLLPRQPNYHLWGDCILKERAATFANGRLYDMGHYPMLVETESGGSIKGCLIEVTDNAYESILIQLDALEGYNPRQPKASAYRRCQRPVRIADGRFVSAWVYIGQEKYVQGKPIVTGGNWEQYVAHKHGQLQAWWQHVNSVAGLHERQLDGND